jgi:hypothetical protein
VADIAKAALRNRVLEHLGVLGAGDTAATADATLVDELVDAAHEELRRFGVVPFATSAIPSWAQDQLKVYVAAMAGPAFGKPWGLAEIEAMKNIARRALAAQVAGAKHNVSPTNKRSFF